MDTYSVVPPPVSLIEEHPLAPSKMKNPGLAFLMSLLLPGAGQLYCGKRRGAWTMFWFGAAAAVFWYTGPWPVSGQGMEMFWGVALRVMLVLYGFSFLDAFFTAREVNRGISDYVDNANPRVAAVLNLTTNGFGYFYLGEQKLGIIVFIVLRMLNSTALGMKGSEGRGLMLILEGVSVILALHAWRKAKDRLADSMPKESAIQANGLPAAVPLSLALLVALNYALFVFGMAALPDYSSIDQKRATIKELQDGTAIYENAQYGLKVTVPPGWKLNNMEENWAFVSAQRDEGACSVQLTATTLLDNSVSDGKQLLKSLGGKFPQARWAGTKASSLGGLPGMETQLQIPMKQGDIDYEMQQRWTVARRGLSKYALISTFNSFDDTCMGEVEQIRNGVVINR